VSVDSWGVDYVGVDESGEPAALPICYRDSRTDGILEQVEASIGADTLYLTSGIQPHTFNTLYQLVADMREGFRPPSHLTMADWFNYRIGGEPVVEASLASTTQMMHAEGPRRWAAKLMARLGLDATAWPRIVPSGTVIGRCTDHPDIAVVASCSHDTGAAVAAVPATAESGSWAYISCGTWSLMGVERTVPILTREARERRGGLGDPRA
jgi:rhamnulokinase